VAILDPAAEWLCTAASLHSKSTNTPWKGRRLTGRCTHAIVGGRLVHQAGKES
jgi:dihydroorotase